MLNLTMPILMNEHTKDNLQIRKDDERKEFEDAHPLYHDRFIIIPFMTKMKWGIMSLYLNLINSHNNYGQPVLVCHDCNENNGRQGFYIITPYACYLLRGYRYETHYSDWNNRVPLLRYWNTEAKYKSYNLLTAGWPKWQEGSEYSQNINSSDTLYTERWRKLVVMAKVKDTSPQTVTLAYIFNGRNPEMHRAWKYWVTWVGENNFYPRYYERISW